MPAVTFSGLSSGIDSASLISQLVSAEKQPATLLQAQQSDLLSHKSIVDNISTQLATLGSLVSKMAQSSDVQYRSVTASDNHASVTVSGDATATTHQVRVLSTAQAQVVSSRTFATDAAGMLGTGGVTISNGTATPVSISWGSTDTLETIASKINDAKAGVSASVLYDGTNYQLMVTSSKTGKANAPTFTDSGDGLALSSASNIKIKAQDAEVLIDNIDVKRPSNVIDDALAGVTITAVSAQAATDPDTTVSVSVDHDAIKKQLGTLVTDYNAVMSSINSQLTYTGTTAGTSTLFGDSTLRQLKTAMSSLISQTFGASTMLDLGLSTDKTGVLALDSDKLDAALNNNPNAVGDLFVTGGLTSTIQKLVNSYTEAGDGILTAKSQGYTDRKNELQKQIDQINDNADQLQTRLQAQFTALEQTMSELNSQSSAISKMLTG